MAEKQPYIQRESYLHRFAKNLLAKELKQIDKSNDSCSFGGLSWRKNYGVFTELAFYETSSPYYFELSKGLKDDVNRKTNPLEWFDKSVNRGKILFVPDIVIFHKGTPMIIIEVVHTHALDYKKARTMSEFFEDFYIEIYQVSASEILRCTGSLEGVTFLKWGYL